jgi:hypothetical protein
MMKKCLTCGCRFNIIAGLNPNVCPQCGETKLAPTFYGDTDYSTPYKDKK